MLVQSSSKSHQFVNLDRDSHIVVRDILLGVGQSVGDDLSDLRVLKVFKHGLGKVSHGLLGSRWSCLG